VTVSAKPRPMSTNEPKAADKRSWIEIDLLRWFDDSEPIRATDNRPAERAARKGEPVAVTPLDPPEFRGAG
jgi:hypothetical protein